MAAPPPDYSVGIRGQLVGCLWYDPFSLVYLTARKGYKSEDKLESNIPVFRSDSGHIVSSPVLFNAVSSEDSLQHALENSFKRKEWIQQNHDRDVPEHLVDPSYWTYYSPQPYRYPKQALAVGSSVEEKFLHPYLLDKNKFMKGENLKPGGFLHIFFASVYNADSKESRESQAQNMRAICQSISNKYREMTQNIQVSPDAKFPLLKKILMGLSQYRWIISSKDRMREPYLINLGYEPGNISKTGKQSKKPIWGQPKLIIPPPDLFAALYPSYLDYLRYTKPSTIPHPFRYVESAVRFLTHNLKIQPPAPDLDIIRVVQGIQLRVEGITMVGKTVLPTEQEFETYSSSDPEFYTKYPHLKDDAIRKVPIVLRSSAEEKEWVNWIVGDHCKVRIGENARSGRKPKVEEGSINNGQDKGNELEEIGSEPDAEIVGDERDLIGSPIKLEEETPEAEIVGDERNLIGSPIKLEEETPEAEKKRPYGVSRALMEDSATVLEKSLSNQTSFVDKSLLKMEDVVSPPEKYLNIDIRISDTKQRLSKSIPKPPEKDLQNKIKSSKSLKQVPLPSANSGKLSNGSANQILSSIESSELYNSSFDHEPIASKKRQFVSAKDHDNSFSRKRNKPIISAKARPKSPAPLVPYLNTSINEQNKTSVVPQTQATETLTNWFIPPGYALVSLNGIPPIPSHVKPLPGTAFIPLNIFSFIHYQDPGLVNMESAPKLQSNHHSPDKLAVDNLNMRDDRINMGDDALDLGDDTLDLGDDTLDLGNDALDLGDDTLDLGDDTLDMSDI